MEWRTDFGALFENTADGVWVSGPDGRILFWNRAAAAILGYPPEQVVGQFCRDVFGGCDSNGNRLCGWPCPIKLLLHGGDLVQHFDMATRTRTGELVWLDISCIAVPAEPGQPPTVIHLFRDVTRAHQIEVLVRQHLAQGPLATSAANVLLNGQLTPREQQVITLMRAGATTAAIAEQLFISKATVRNHIQNIFSKLGVHTRLAAVAYMNQVTQRGPTPRAATGGGRGSPGEPAYRRGRTD
ncbi:MAG TPA: LuxR C-terminal-related transcriptional regulator [Alphaproteobacteria bacterium]|nr:LuxR C-terminal-related transcriptional regulator [Alphaproteobacteria bacterium]